VAHDPTHEQEHDPVGEVIPVAHDPSEAGDVADIVQPGVRDDRAVEHHAQVVHVRALPWPRVGIEVVRCNRPALSLWKRRVDGQQVGLPLDGVEELHAVAEPGGAADAPADVPPAGEIVVDACDLVQGQQRDADGLRSDDLVARVPATEPAQRRVLVLGSP